MYLQLRIHFAWTAHERLRLSVFSAVVSSMHWKDELLKCVNIDLDLLSCTRAAVVSGPTIIATPAIRQSIPIYLYEDVNNLERHPGARGGAHCVAVLI